MPFEGARQRCIEGQVLDAAPDPKGEASARREDAAHLSQRQSFLGEESHCNPCWQQTRSKLSAGKGRRAASAACHSIAGPPAATGMACAVSSIPGLTSSPTTWPEGPTSGAEKRATVPVPHATSRT